MTIETQKQRAIAALHDVPDDASIEDAIERLCFVAKIGKVFETPPKGRLVPQEELKQPLRVDPPPRAPFDVVT